MKYKRAFTLIELLVVIAIIAMLLAIVMPALKKAKEAGKRIICQSNVRQLTQAWKTYSEENKGVLAPAMTSGITSAEPFGWGQNSPTWVGWTTNVDNRLALEAAITLGTFYPYTNTLKAYHCANHEAANTGVTDTTQVKRIRSYSIADSLNGYDFIKYSGLQYGRPVRQLTELRNSSVQIVFIDEGRETAQGWSIHPDPMAYKFWDVPGSQHNKGTVLSFADGHAEHWQWKDPKTLAFIERAKSLSDYGASYNLGEASNQSTNPDYQKLYRGIWGTGRK
ncbi:MAG: type II secretion system protein [Anaerohalosphaeraceae bacterium]